MLDAVEKLKRKDVVSATQIKNFMKDILKFIIAMLEKIFEKIILGFSLVRAATIFNPDFLLELSKQKLIDRLKMLLKHFMTLSICSATQCDQALADLSTFYQNELKHAKLNGSKFEKDKDRVDDFYVNELCFTVQRVALCYQNYPMSHGQVAVERGFNISNSALKTNISPEGVIAKRLVKDHLIANNLKPHSIQITNPMIRAFKGARQSYVIYLDDENKKKIQTKDEEKAKHITSDIENLKQKLKTNQKAVSMMENEYTQYTQKSVA